MFDNITNLNNNLVQTIQNDYMLDAENRRLVKQARLASGSFFSRFSFLFGAVSALVVAAVLSN